MSPSSSSIGSPNLNQLPFIWSWWNMLCVFFLSCSIGVFWNFTKILKFNSPFFPVNWTSEISSPYMKIMFEIGAKFPHLLRLPLPPLLPPYRMHYLLSFFVSVHSDTKKRRNFIFVERVRRRFFFSVKPKPGVENPSHREEILQWITLKKT